MISAEQMLDAYSSIGMPVFYSHWSFGKRFVRDEKLYRKGYTGLAYEIVINSDPCISYIMEENTMTMQALVMAHAAFGHNHFFKNNYLFKEGTDAEGILDYLSFAKAYVARCGSSTASPPSSACSMPPTRSWTRASTAMAGARARAWPRRRSAPTLAAPITRAPSTICGAPCRPRPSPRRREKKTDAALHRLGLPEETCSTSSRSFRRACRTGSANWCASCASSPSTSTRRSRPRS